MKLRNLKSWILSESILWEQVFGSVYFRSLSRVVVRQKANGEKVPPFNYILLDRGNSVSALILLATTDGEKLVMVRQYRAGTNEYLLELPAGMVDEGEDPAEAVVREVMEETGFGYSSMQYLRHLVLSPGSYTEQSDIYIFETDMSLKKEKGGGKFSESEEIEIVYVPVAEAVNMMKRGDITDAKTVVALLELQIHLMSR